MKKIILFLFILSVKTVSSQGDFERSLSSISLATLNQETFSLNEIKKNAASVFVFLLSDCPACESYSLTLNRLSEKCISSGIRFYGVFPGDYSTIPEMKEFQNRYHINFLLMTDPEKKLVKSLGAKVAPGVFVVNSSGQTIYRGRIDDWMYAVGKKKQVITRHELEEALNAIMKHLPVKVKKTVAIGCIID